MAAPCGNKTSRGHACYPLTTYCPNRPATYKRDTNGRPAKSAIYKPDIQPKPRPHAYTHAYTGTPARLHPRKTHCTHPRTHTTARGPAKSQVMSEKGHQKRPKQPESHPHPLTDKQNQPNSQVVSKRGGHPTSKQPETSRTVPPSAHNRAKTVKTASHEQKGHQKRPKTGRIIPPSAHNPCFSTIQAICAPQQHPCATSDMHTHANTSTHTETQHVPQAHKHHAPHTEHDQTHTPAHRRSDVTGLRRR